MDQSPNARRGGPTFESALCVTIAIKVLLGWVAFAAQHQQALQGSAVAAAFMRQHRALGEDPAFILEAALTVRVPPTSLIRSPVFLGASGLAGVQLVSLLHWRAAADVGRPPRAAIRGRSDPPAAPDLRRGTWVDGAVKTSHDQVSRALS